MKIKGSQRVYRTATFPTGKHKMKNEIDKPGTLEAPPMESVFSSALVLLSTGVMSFGFVMPNAGSVVVIVILSVVLLVSTLKRYVFAIHLTLFSLLLFIPSRIGAISNQWPLGIMVPLLAYGLIVIVVPGLRESIGWLKKGRMDAKVIKLVLATSIISAIALFSWVIIIKSDIAHQVDLIPVMPLWLYPIAGLGFAIFNATMEEVVFRGIVMDATDRALGYNFISVVVQAVPFAAFHYLVGFPNGLLGFFMVFVYGVMLGAVRRASKGMLAPLMAHVAADITIFTILVVSYFQG